MDNKIFKAGITVAGKFVYGRQYDILTQVFYDPADGGDGCSYVSLTANQNIIPGTNPNVWVKSSERGEKGDQGIPGTPGPEGIGFDTVSTNRNGVVVMTLTNGDTVTMDLAHEHPQYMEYEITGTI